MDISVPSRFACLKIEDDDFHPTKSHAKKKPEKFQTKKPTIVSKEASKGSWISTRKKENDNDKWKTAPKKQRQKQKEEQEKDWEEWQKKDTKFINEVFEQQMQNAILQSKLEFEQAKKSAVKVQPEQNLNKKKKGKTMSWEQFMETTKEVEIKDDTKIIENDSNFFDEVFATTKKEITKERVEQNMRKRQEAFEEGVSLAQIQEKLEEERAKSAALEKELKEARKEIALVKKRNSTLCSMLSQGEMKEKAQVLLELERLTAVKEELTEEVAKLHKLLEQERSNKNNVAGADTHSKHKEKSKKKK